ncbi:MAG: PQQ-binding-like beta-propeller repeat protein [Gemmataceae bacterium]
MRWLLWCCSIFVLASCGPTLLPSVAEETVSADPDETLPENLWTRKTGEDWPCFLGPRHDSTSAEKGLIVPWPKPGPRIVWEKEIGIGYSMPVVARGRLFLFDRLRNRCRLRAMKAETGETLWTYEYPTDYRDQYGYNGGPRSSPVVDGNRVYCFGPEGMLCCVRVSDGKLVWKLDTTATYGVVQNFFGVGSSPIVEGDLLLVPIGGSPPGSRDVAFDELKGNGSGVVAFDKYTGKEKWKATDELASYASPVVKTIGKRRWCFVFARGGLVGLDPTTGKVDFTYPWRANLLESVNAANPVVSGERVLITECYQVGSALLEVRPGGVKEIWTDKTRGRNKALACHWNTPIIADDHVYGSSGRNKSDAELRCVELATGKVKWAEPGLTRCQLLKVEEYLICLSETGVLDLLKINPARYERLSRVVLQKDGRPLLEEPAWAAPILSHGLLWVRGDSRLVCLEVIHGRK